MRGGDGSLEAAEPSEEAACGFTSPPLPADILFQCLQCAKLYGSTDAARKHCRKNHAEWLETLPHGDYRYFCTAVKADGAARSLPPDGEP